MSLETTKRMKMKTKTKEYKRTAGEVMYPVDPVDPVDSLMPVKGVHEVAVGEGGRGGAEQGVGGSFSGVR